MLFTSLSLNELVLLIVISRAEVMRSGEVGISEPVSLLSALLLLTALHSKEGMIC